MKKLIILLLALFVLSACGGPTVNKIATIETSFGTIKIELL